MHHLELSFTNCPESLPACHCCAVLAFKSYGLGLSFMNTFMHILHIHTCASPGIILFHEHNCTATCHICSWKLCSWTRKQRCACVAI